MRCTRVSELAGLVDVLVLVRAGFVLLVAVGLRLAVEGLLAAGVLLLGFFAATPGFVAGLVVGAVRLLFLVWGFLDLFLVIDGKDLSVE